MLRKATTITRRVTLDDNESDSKKNRFKICTYCDCNYGDPCRNIALTDQTVPGKCAGMDSRSSSMGSDFFYIVACVLLLPGSVLTLGAGFLFGVPLGLLSAWTGATLGACAAFLVGRTLARDWVAGKVSGNPKFAAVDEAVGREGFKIVLLLRMSPIFPFNFLNYALGLTKVSFVKYALASLIGMLPGGLMYVYFGSAARSLADVAAGKVEDGWAGQIFFWVGLAATIIVAGFVTRLAKRSLKQAEQARRPGLSLET